MKTITIRGIEPEVSERLKSNAAKQGKSVNQLTIDIITESLGLKKERRFSRVYSDLDTLFGRWTDSEFEEINGKITRERKIDRELWE